MLLLAGQKVTSVFKTKKTQTYGLYLDIVIKIMQFSLKTKRKIATANNSEKFQNYVFIPPAVLGYHSLIQGLIIGQSACGICVGRVLWPVDIFSSFFPLEFKLKTKGRLGKRDTCISECSRHFLYKCKDDNTCFGFLLCECSCIRQTMYSADL